MINSIGSDIVDSHLNIIALGFRQDSLKKLFKSNFLGDYKQIVHDLIDLPTNTNNPDVLKVARYIDKNISLEGDMLVKVDRASMLCSLECRSPFLDHRLMEYTNTLPDSFLLLGGNKKRILKDAFSDMLPNKFFQAPKRGFEIPLSYWFRHELKSELKNTLSKGNLESHPFFNVDYVQTLIQEHMNGEKDHSNKLWTLFCFQKWYNHNMV